MGTALARQTGIRFVDGDDLHPATNVAKMARGEALTDADRWPWLIRVGETLKSSEGPCIVGCSALRRVYRDLIAITAGAPVTFLFLDAPRAVLERRLARRPGHFFPASLLDSQLATLEPPGPGETHVRVDAGQRFRTVVEALAAALGSGPR